MEYMCLWCVFADHIEIGELVMSNVNWFLVAVS